jgi:hypothetical protein
MSVPYNNDTRETYIQRMKDGFLHIAHSYYELKQENSMWLALLYYAIAEDLYGEHWDTTITKLKEKNT